MKIFILAFYLIVWPTILLFSQDVSPEPPNHWTRFLYLESGFMYPVGTIKESIAIRQNISSYYVDQPSNGNISSTTSGFIMGLRWEYFNNKFKTGVSTGLRYTGFRSEITGFSSSNADFFYLRYSMMNSDTKFARVKSITETNNFISIPLEFRFIPIQYKGFGLFAKVGAEVSRFNLKKGVDINFQDNTMEIHQELILNSIGVSTNKLYSTFYGSIGLKIGQEYKPNYLFEIFLPSVFNTRHNFALTNIDYFEGFKFSVQFPVK
jgi:hypothetical protein